jgi:hypothetical protein
MGKQPLTSTQMRTLLSNTGTPQIYDTSRHVGAMPNIHAAAKSLHTTMVTCTMNYNLGNYGGYGFNNIMVKNVSGAPITGWQAYLDFGGATPTNIQWISGATATIKEKFILVESATTLAPGATAQFSLGGQYAGANIILVSCL